MLFRTLSRAFSRQTVGEIVNKYPVVVFSKSTCPFCSGAKQRLKAMGVTVHVVEVDIHDQGPDYHKALLEMTNQKTVPYIFINQNFIGGQQELMTKDIEALLNSSN